MVLRVRVVAADTGNPVAAFVIIRRAGETTEFSERTDDQGVVQFNDFTPGTITITAARGGFDQAQREVTVTAATTVELSLVPRRATLAGRVTDLETRQPLAGATVAVLDGDNAERAAIVDSTGHYSLPDLWFGGFTIRVRHAAYDSVFRGVRLTQDTVLDVEMRRAQQSLAGTWTGTADVTTGQRFSFPEVTLTHSQATVANAPGESAYSFFAFTGSLRDPDRIGSTTDISGTLRWRITKGNPRTPTTCNGTGTFDGTVNWTNLRIAAPHIVYDCADEPPVGVTLTLVRQE